jgi:hypothetical protein
MHGEIKPTAVARSLEVSKAGTCDGSEAPAKIKLAAVAVGTGRRPKRNRSAGRNPAAERT